MATGKVKWFNNAKGYGFIPPEGGGEDLFVHYSTIQMEGYKTLKAGQDVVFEVLQGPKGYHAVNVEPSETDEASDDGTAPEAASAGIGIDARDAGDRERSPALHNGASETTS